MPMTEQERQEFNRRQEAQSMRRAKLETALDAAGIGHDPEVKLTSVVAKIAEFCALVQKRATNQAIYDRLHNVPMGILPTLGGADYFAEHAISSGIAGACGVWVKWDVTRARELAADILEDVNDHKTAKLLRDCAEKAEVA